MRRRETSKVALILMPWANPVVAPLGMAVLKNYLNLRGISADCFYFNVRLLRWSGELINAFYGPNYGLLGEWLFSYHLFGPGGLREHAHELEDILSHEELKDSAVGGVPGSTLEKLLREDIPDFLDHCLNAVRWDQYDLVGFSSMFNNHVASLTLAKRIKEKYPGIPIVMGGANVEGDMGIATLKGCEWIDYVIDGEGEEALAALVQNIKKNNPYEKIPRLSFRHKNKISARCPADYKLIDMKDVPPPDHEDYFQELEDSKLSGKIVPHLTFEASRGCWWGQKQHCTFCGLNGQAMSFRAKAPQVVADELLLLHRKYKSYQFQACDNILGIEHLRELIPLLARVRAEHSLDWEVFFEVKSNLRIEQVQALADAGVKSMQPGIESLSTPVLRLMRKGVSAIQNIQTLKAAQLAGIYPVWNILWGFPKEDPRDYEKMSEKIPSLTHFCPPMAACMIRIDRFSPYHSEWKRFGISKLTPAAHYRFIYPSSRFNLDEIAYYFKMEMADGAPSPEIYAKPLITPLFKLWCDVYYKNYFAYKKGRGFMEVYDSRPMAAGAAPRHRQYSVAGLDAAVLEACFGIAGFGDILSACRRDYPGCREEEILEILRRMVSARWIFEENGMYLALPLPMRCLPQGQRQFLEQMLAFDLIKNAQVPERNDSNQAQEHRRGCFRV